MEFCVYGKLKSFLEIARVDSMVVDQVVQPEQSFHTLWAAAGSGECQRLRLGKEIEKSLCLTGFALIYKPIQ